MISKEIRAELQRKFDELEHDPEFQRQCVEAEIRLRKSLAIKIREHRQFLARSRENAGHRVIR